MKCGPDDCPIVAFSDLTPAEQRVERQRTAKKMTDQGFTEQQIAKQLGVSQQTISNDLANLPITGKSKPAKTASNPKGAGRPKGKKPQPRRRKTDAAKEAAAASLVLDQGKTYEQVANELGLSSVQPVKTAVAREEGRREARAEPEIDRSELSLTAQEKFDAAMRQHRRKLDLEFDQRVRDAVTKKIEEIVLPAWRQRVDEAKQLYNRRKALMDKATFNAIRRGLHPDSRNSISDEVLGRAFDKFMALEKFLLDEKDSPTEIADVPSNLAEWDKMRMKPRRKAGANPVSRRI